MQLIPLRKSIAGYILLVFLCACSAVHVSKTTSGSFVARDPARVALCWATEKLESSYRAIGIIKVNRWGLALAGEPGSLGQILRMRAAEMGGNGVINIRGTAGSFTGTVVLFEP